MNLPTLREKFLDFLKGQERYSQATLLAYGRDLEQFFEFLQTTTGDAEGSRSWNARSVRSFLGWLAANGRENATLERKLAAIRKFSRWLVDLAIVDEEITGAIQSPKKKRFLPSFLEKEQVFELLEKIEPNSHFRSRDRALFELIFAAGLRSAEAVGLDLGDIDLKERITRVFGKGEKERLLPFGRPCRDSLVDYIDNHRPFLAAKRNRERPETALFLNRWGGRLSTRSVRRNLKKHLLKVGLSAKLSPHAFRHSFATLMLYAGMDIRSVQQLLGHASLNTTQRYTHIGSEQLMKTFQKYHPRS